MLNRNEKKRVKREKQKKAKVKKTNPPTADLRYPISNKESSYGGSSMSNDEV
jgi:hypothetical protein